jgi:tRNA(adenine34) deaminase
MQQTQTRLFNKRMLQYVYPILAFSLVGCSTPPPPKNQGGPQTVAALQSTRSTPLSKASTPTLANPKAVAEERDALYTLLAYSLVLEDWQTSDSSHGARGHNIGCVLVNPQGRLVHSALNSNGKYKNGTQHGETRVMWQYQADKRLYDLKGYSIYTTLEPCAMCSGMMIMQKVSRTVYGQTDIDFGKAVERLQLDSSKFDPYPRSTDLESTPANLPVRVDIDRAYKRQYDTDKGSITGWLRGEEAKALYTRARSELLGYQVRHEENQPVLDDCLKALKKG